MPRSPLWKKVERLAASQEYQAAFEQVEAIRQEVLTDPTREAELTEALVKQVQLRIALNGPETAARFVIEQPWPKSLLDRAILELLLGHTLMAYLRQYTWEIRGRTRVETTEDLDLKAMTADQIVAASTAAYQRIWAVRSELDQAAMASLGELVQPGTYPKLVRGTLRDLLSYLAVELLVDTAHWSPEQSNDLYRLGLERLLADRPDESAAVRLDDATVHPLARACAVLDDLAAWHDRAGRANAAMEARLERIRRLHAAFSEPDDRRAIEQDLRRRLNAGSRTSWRSVGFALLARFVKLRGDLLEAHRVAQEGAAATSIDPVGRRQCTAIAAEIELPDYAVRCMASDGMGRRSIEIRHKNLRVLHFRAYAVDLVEHVLSTKDYAYLPNHNDWRAIAKESRRWLGAREPSFEWTVELPDTPDYELHTTYVVPPMDRPGLYVLMASVHPSFRERSGNRIMAGNILLGDLVLLVTKTPECRVEVMVISGADGAPVAGVEVMLGRFDWQEKHVVTERGVTDEHGQVTLAPSLEALQSMYFVLAQKDGQAAVYAGNMSLFPDPTARAAGTLIYTDRSIYRPEQRLSFKVMPFGVDDATGRPAIMRGASCTVSLLDPNNETVASETVTTNEFGTASGSFIVPAGRLLGQWKLTSSHRGVPATVRVEEYKRPTFEVRLLDPATPPRLNQTSTLRGEARYYFGLPVAGGVVRWRVERAPRPPIWLWWLPRSDPRPHRIAAGESVVADDGTFELSFVAEVDPRKAAVPGTSFTYTVHAELTDEGGETRSTRRAFRLGFAGIEATIAMDARFAREGAPATVTVHRADLDGAPRAGAGRWTLRSVEQPQDVVPGPADLALAVDPTTETDAEEPGAFRLPGDALRPRWDGGYRYERVINGWADGPVIAQGEASHGPDGRAEIALQPLSAGVYRLGYETRDEDGARVEVRRTFLCVGPSTPLALPAICEVESTSVRVGEVARIFAGSGTLDQVLFLDTYFGGRRVDRKILRPGDQELFEIRVHEAWRGGFGVALAAVRDFQLVTFSHAVFVPWDDRELSIEFGAFRDKLRPGARERWQLTVRSARGEPLGPDVAEVLAYMYDRSLEALAPHVAPSVLALYPDHTGVRLPMSSLGVCGLMSFLNDALAEVPEFPVYEPASLLFFPYGTGGPGQFRVFRGGGMPPPSPMAMAAMAPPMARMSAPAAPQAASAGQSSYGASDDSDEAPMALVAGSPTGGAGEAGEAPVELRSNFAETAFFYPHLRTAEGGAVVIEFDAPEAVTSWAVWVHAITRDLCAGTARREARTVKELMVRPQVPRFFREGDVAELRVMVDNAGERPLAGTVTVAVIDPETEQDLSEAFGLEAARADFEAPAGRGVAVAFGVRVPARVGPVALRVVARAGDLSDGEIRPLPVLPARMHLFQSRFVALRDRDRRVVTFEDMARTDDPTRVDDALVVTVDAQLFFTVLKAVPFLVDYPYECCEQLLNRFVPASILAGVYERFPAVVAAVKSLPPRGTRLERFDAEDPNRRMALEETPWLREARGGEAPEDHPVVDLLDPALAVAHRDKVLAKLEKAQTSLGGFPWFPGGPPSPYITLYLLEGLARAREFGVAAPERMVMRAWRYLGDHFRSDILPRLRKDQISCESITFLLFTLTAYADTSLAAKAFSESEREEMLAYAWKEWREHAPMLKLYLALVLHRGGRAKDARLVLASVMDSARTEPDRGTFWAPEDRAWLWYNDTTETHAFALRTLAEIAPEDPRRDGLVLWLLLDKKLNHWKSTRATAAAIYALVHHMAREESLAVREQVRVHAGGRSPEFVFEPERYEGRARLALRGGEIDPGRDATVVVEKETPGFAFMSATWHYSTERLPSEARGDFFKLTRRYFKRESGGAEAVLRPLSDAGVAVAVGDEVEVHLAITVGHASEYVHLRDPRPAGFEPAGQTSGYRSELGLLFYEEVRDSGMNFFFERLPVGQFTLRHRMRAAVAGEFRSHPATVQGMYAPEFVAYSGGERVVVGG